MGWRKIDSGRTIGAPGGEQGAIVRDEGYDGLVRITLESRGVSAPFAVTCVIDRWMTHSCVYFREDQAQIQFQRMKEAVAGIADMIAELRDAPEGEHTYHITAAIANFIERFP